MLGSWEIAYIDSTHRKLSKTGLRCSGTILEGGVLFIDPKYTICSCYTSGVLTPDYLLSLAYPIRTESQTSRHP